MTLVTAGALLACVLAILPVVLGGGRPGLHASPRSCRAFDLAFEVEPLGMLFALIAAGLWIVNSLYSIGYMRANAEVQQTRFYVCFALALAATMGIAFAANLFTLFVFYEMLTLVTYPLVTHHGTEEARRGGRIYLGLLLGTSIMFLLPALAFTWFVAGTIDFTPGGILAGKLGGVGLGVLLALYMFGIGKAALMPFHRWLPAAMVAPTPVSALLHAVAVVKAGVFSVVKVIIYVFGIDTLLGAGVNGWLVAVAGFTIVAASVVALKADNLKRRLAYSTVSQLSYVVLAAALLAPLVADRGGAAHRRARGGQDHAVLRRRRHLHRRAQDRGQRARRHRPAHALDDGRVRDRRDLDDRPAADRRLRLQVVHAFGRDGGGALGRAGRHHRQHAAECRLLPAHRLPRVLSTFARGAGRTRGGTAVDGDCAGGHCRRHGAVVLLARRAAGTRAADVGRRVMTMSKKTLARRAAQREAPLARVPGGARALRAGRDRWSRCIRHFDIESLFGFHAWFGFLACVAMIGVAKALSLLLKRPDTYYDRAR